MADPQPPRSFGVVKPTGHVVIPFPSASHAELAAQRLQAIGLREDAVLHYTDTEMLHQIDIDRQHAGELADLGQELDLVLAHRALAERGCHWLVVRAADDDLARRVADVARGCGAERARAYGRFVIEELIAPDTDLPAADRPGARTASGLGAGAVPARAPVAARTMSGRRRSA